MNIITKTLTFSFILLVSTYVQALPNAFTANYKVQKSGMYLGNMQSALSYQGQQYHYHKKTTAKGLAAMLSGDVLIENSDGVVRNNRFITKRYLRHHTSKRKDQKDQFHFNSPTMVQGNYDNRAYTLTVPHNTTDLTALEIQLMQALATNRITQQYNVVDRGQLVQYEFQKLGTEKLTLPAGDFTCEKVRISKKGSSVETLLWLAKELSYTPVRIQHIDGGDILEARMTSYKAQ